MFRRLFRAVRHFLGAVVLVFGSVCLVEVVLGVRHASQIVENQTETVDNLSVPSRSFFRELRPLSVVPTSAGEIRTNSFGLRGPEPHCPKPPGVYRVLVLGDEATLATHLADGQTFCNQLQDSVLQGRTSLPVEVINAGQPGGCPLTLSLLYRQRLATLAADAVVIVLSASDVTDDMRCRPFLRIDESSKPLACPHPSLGGREQPIDVWRSEFRLVDWAASKSMQTWLDRGSRVRSDLLSPSRESEWLTTPAGVWAGPIETALEPLKQLKADVESRYGQFIVTVAPDESSLKGPAPGWQTVARYVAENRMIWIDPLQRLNQLPNADSIFLANTTPIDIDTLPLDVAATDDDSCEQACQSKLSEHGHKLLAIELAMHFVAQPGLAVTPQDTTTR